MVVPVVTSGLPPGRHGPITGGGRCARLAVRGVPYLFLEKVRRIAPCAAHKGGYTASTHEL